MAGDSLDAYFSRQVDNNMSDVERHDNNTSDLERHDNNTSNAGIQRQETNSTATTTVASQDKLSRISPRDAVDTDVPTDKVTVPAKGLHLPPKPTYHGNIAQKGNPVVRTVPHGYQPDSGGERQTGKTFRCKILFPPSRACRAPRNIVG